MSSTAITSGLLSASAQIKTGKTYVSGVFVITDSVNPATVTLYDSVGVGTNANTIAKVSATSTTGANSLAFISRVRCDTGLYCQITGTGAPQAIVLYEA